MTRVRTMSFILCLLVPIFGYAVDTSPQEQGATKDPTAEMLEDFLRRVEQGTIGEPVSTEKPLPEQATVVKPQPSTETKDPSGDQAKKNPIDRAIEIIDNTPDTVETEEEPSSSMNCKGLKGDQAFVCRTKKAILAYHMQQSLALQGIYAVQLPLKDRFFRSEEGRLRGKIQTFLDTNREAILELLAYLDHRDLYAPGTLLLCTISQNIVDLVVHPFSRSKAGSRSTSNKPAETGTSGTSAEQAASTYVFLRDKKIKAEGIMAYTTAKFFLGLPVCKK